MCYIVVWRDVDFEGGVRDVIIIEFDVDVIYFYKG